MTINRDGSGNTNSIGINMLYDVISRYYDGISVEMIAVKGVVVDVIDVVVVVALSNHDSTSDDAPFGGVEILLRRQ